MILIKEKIISVYSKWNGWKLECVCYKENPGCINFKECEEIEMSIDPYKNIKECKKSRSFKRHRGALRQVK